jgi:hypothetical protein
VTTGELHLRADLLEADLALGATADSRDDEIRALRHLVKALALQAGSHGVSVSAWAWREALAGRWRVDVEQPDPWGDRRVRPVPVERER